MREACGQKRGQENRDRDPARKGQNCKRQYRINPAITESIRKQGKPQRGRMRLKCETMNKSQLKRIKLRKCALQIRRRPSFVHSLLNLEAGVAIPRNHRLRFHPTAERTNARIAAKATYVRLVGR